MPQRSNANRDLRHGGYPFQTGHWSRWTTAERLKWLRNFRDRLTENDGALAAKFGLTQQDIDQLIKDTEAIERLDLIERVQKN